MSLRVLGAAVGVTAQSVWQWEHGKSQVPSQDLPALARALGASYEDLLGDLTGSGRAPAGGRGDTTIADRVRDRLLAAWSDVPSEEVAAIDALAASLERWRAVLLQQEHAQQAPATNAAR